MTTTTIAEPESTPEPYDEDDAAHVMLARVGVTPVAVPTTQLREVIRARPATRVPGTPGWIRGIVAVRGALVPVADLAWRAHAPVSLDASRDGDAVSAPWLALVEHDGRAVAIGVTGFDGVYRVAAELPSASRTSDTLPRRGAVRLATDGVAESGDARDVDVLDVGALLDQIFDGE